MNTKLRILIVFLMAAAILLPTAPANAKTTRINFTGSEWCDESTLTLIREWMAGPNYQARGLSQICFDTADIPQMTGTDYLYDGQLKIVGKGAKNFIISGKLRMETAEGGIWLGSWVLPANSTTIQVIGHGEGLYEGRHLHWFLSLEGPFEGYID
jgi:hypothetical protein